MVDNVSIVLAFGAGLLSFLSPCVLPMVPVYLASLYGQEASVAPRPRLPVFMHALSFVIGFTIIFVLLGAIAGMTGHAVIPDYAILGKIAGGLLVVFGLVIILSTWVPWLNYEKRLTIASGKTTGYLRSFGIGAAFSLSWTACVGPILASILAIASVQATAWRGASLLAVYSLGLGLPFLAVGAAFDFLQPWLKRLGRAGGIIRPASGLLLIVVGAFILAGKLTWIASLAG
jgi:cytochrome c-type biogenesis protein